MWSLRVHSLALLPFLALAAPAAPAGEVSAERAEELERLVHQDCGSCHGMALDGGLGPALPPERMNAYDRDELAKLILQGVPDTAMPAWESQLSEAEARWLARYLQNRQPSRQD